MGECGKQSRDEWAKVVYLVCLGPEHDHGQRKVGEVLLVLDPLIQSEEGIEIIYRCLGKEIAVFQRGPAKVSDREYLVHRQQKRPKLVRKILIEQYFHRLDAAGAACSALRRELSKTAITCPRLTLGNCNRK